MEILVCIKQVPESNKVEVDPVTGVLNRSSAASKMNPYDLYALETALRLRQELGGRVSVMTMGPAQAEAVIREAYAMGADEGWLITDRRFGGADVLATSYTLSQGIRRAGPFDLILCGKQTTDGDTAQVGSEISEALSLPAVAGVLRILSAEAEAITVEMDLTDKVETVRVSLPLPALGGEGHRPAAPAQLRAQAGHEGYAHPPPDPGGHGGHRPGPLRAQRFPHPGAAHLSPREQPQAGEVDGHRPGAGRAAVRPAEGTKAVAGRALKWQS